METKKQTNSTQETWKPSRGMRYSFHEGRPAPYYLHWRDKNTGKRMAVAFSNPEDREKKAKSLTSNVKKYGEDTLSFNPIEWRKWMEFKRLVNDSDPIVIAHHWLQYQQGATPIQSKKISDAVTGYLRLRDLENCWGKDSRRHVKKHLERFVIKFGTLHLHQIEKTELRNWMHALKDEEGKKLGPHAINQHRKNINLFFQYALDENWGARENPCASIKPLKTDNTDPVVIPLRDAFEFFKINHSARATARVALEAFAGIRYTTSGLIEKEALNTEAKGIRMKASIHKSGKKDGRSRYRQGQPDNLWKWIEHAPETIWTMSALDYREEKRHAYIKAGLRPAANASNEDAKIIRGLRNIWRHSFISYHLAAYRNLPLTQYLAQHSNSRITEDYEGIADHEEGLRYFMIAPETVKLTWEQFIKLPLPNKDSHILKKATALQT